MKIGDKVKFAFAKKKIEGTVTTLFDKTVYIKADFPNHPNKLIKRKIHQIK